MIACAYSELVPNEQLAREVQRVVDSGEMSFCAIARTVYPLRHDRPDPDVSRLMRCLGLSSPGARAWGRAKHQRRLRYDMAVRICIAAHIDPVDAGL